MWDQLLPLLSKCQTAGCASAVTEENMEKFNDGGTKWEEHENIFKCELKVLLWMWGCYVIVAIPTGGVPVAVCNTRQRKFTN